MSRVDERSSVQHLCRRYGQAEGHRWIERRGGSPAESLSAITGEPWRWVFHGNVFATTEPALAPLAFSASTFTGMSSTLFLSRTGSSEAELIAFSS